MSQIYCDLSLLHEKAPFSNLLQQTNTPEYDFSRRCFSAIPLGI